MFHKLSVVATAALLTLAAAVPTNSPPPGTTAQCCNSVQSSDSSSLAGILGLLGVVLDAVVPIGLSCSPITVIGNNCGSTQVECDAQQTVLGGLLAINCLNIVL
ncbi:Hydrophobin 2 [Mycena venus]|uniref:Hydrophobin n=1 Tax=Mycena venus TaxID=2733690 RepID=A0A8H6YWP6_9AGAR|nr:Hydrophobin 2 [Mycena venus]